MRDIADVLSVRDKPEKLEGENKVLEFKHNFEDLLNDFEEKNKNPQELDICVCWVVPDLNVARGRIEPTYDDWKDHRRIYGGSYLWVDDNDSTEVEIIALKNVLAELLARHEIREGKPGIGQGTLNPLVRRDKAAIL